MVFILLCFIHSPMHGRPDGDDSDDGGPPASLGRSTSEAAIDPLPTNDRMGEGASHTTPPASNTEGGPEATTAEVNSLAVREDARDQGMQASPGHEGLAHKDPASSAPMTSKSSDQTRTSPGPLSRDDVGRIPSPMLSPETNEPAGRRHEVEAVLNNSSIPPKHQAMLGVGFT